PGPVLPVRVSARVYPASNAGTPSATHTSVVFCGQYVMTAHWAPAMTAAASSTRPATATRITTSSTPSTITTCPLVTVKPVITAHPPQVRRVGAAAAGSGAERGGPPRRARPTHQRSGRRIAAARVRGRDLGPD